MYMYKPAMSYNKALPSEQFCVLLTATVYIIKVCLTTYSMIVIMQNTQDKVNSLKTNT